MFVLYATEWRILLLAVPVMVFATLIYDRRTDSFTFGLDLGSVAAASMLVGPPAADRLDLDGGASDQYFQDSEWPIVLLVAGSVAWILMGAFIGGILGIVASIINTIAGRAAGSSESGSR